MRLPDIIQMWPDFDFYKTQNKKQPENRTNVLLAPKMLSKSLTVIFLRALRRLGSSLHQTFAYELFTNAFWLHVELNVCHFYFILFFKVLPFFYRTRTKIVIFYISLLAVFFFIFGSRDFCTQAKKRRYFLLPKKISAKFAVPLAIKQVHNQNQYVLVSVFESV